MSKNDGDNIERFFRKAADQYRIEFNENDWNEMEKMLEKEARRTASGKKIKNLVLVMCAYFIMLAGIYLLSSRLDPRNNQSSLSSNDTTVQSSQNLKDPSTDSLKPDTLQVVSEFGRMKLDTKVFSREKKNTKHLAPSFFKRNLSMINLNSNIFSQPYSLFPSTKSYVKRQHYDQYKTFNETGHISFNGAIADTINVSSQIATAIPENQIKSNRDSVRKNTEPTDIGFTLETAIAPQVLQSQQVGSDSSTAWGITLTAAPDFTTLGLGERYTSPGQTFGLNVSYYFSNKLSIRTGILRSYKKYLSEGYEYEPPTGYWSRFTNGVVPEKVDGACTVLEIPLTIQYYVTGSGKHRVFVSAGVSSYVILDESYKYIFSSPNPGAKDDWSSSKNSDYLFNVAVVSAGYERPISCRLAIGIEPYIKIPLSGMGWADVDLFSTGAYFTLRYQILKKEIHGRSSRPTN